MMTDTEQDHGRVTALEPVRQAPRISDLSTDAQRAIEEVRGKILVAKQFPRDVMEARAAILEECKRPELAEMAIYKYPRGGATVSGPSIRLMEAVARNYGNFDFGMRELSQSETEAVCESYAWDMEKNVTRTVRFVVKLERKARGEVVALEDPRDKYEMSANMASRRTRACIEAVIPKWITLDAMKQCVSTMRQRDQGKPLAVRITDMADAFRTRFQVTPEMLTRYLGHPLEEANEEELEDLRTVFASLKDGMTKRADWFNVHADPAKSPQQNLKERLAAEKEEAAAPAPPAPQPEPEPELPPQAEDPRELESRCTYALAALETLYEGKHITQKEMASARKVLNDTTNKERRDVADHYNKLVAELS